MPGKFQDTSCVLKCPDSFALDSQEHQLTCVKLASVHSEVRNTLGKVEYSDIYSDTTAQKHITVMFAKLLVRRDVLLALMTRTAIE